MYADYNQSNASDTEGGPVGKNVENMTAIFVTDWAKRRGGGGRACGGGNAGIRNATGLEILEDAYLLHEPSCTSTTFSPNMDHNVINSIRSFETKFVAVIITHVQIIPTANHEALSQLPVASQKVLRKGEVILRII